MSKQPHTPSLLCVSRGAQADPFSLEAQSGTVAHVKMIPGLAGLRETEANANRLADCWNACAGIDDPADLRRQRDELLDALQAMVCAGHGYIDVDSGIGPYSAESDELNHAKAVLHRIYNP